MLLIDLVRTSEQIGATSSRLEKTLLLSACLQRLGHREVEIGVSYLSGRLRQGNIGIGPAMLGTLLPGPVAVEPSLSLVDVDRIWQAIATTTGSGAGSVRRRWLAMLMAKATHREQRFLAGLALGELRQGALEGVMVEALAKATGVPASRVRRAVMLAGDLIRVAVAVLSDGLSGLERFRLQVLQPVHPMLAQPADDVEAALHTWGEAAFEYKMDGARIQLHKLGDEVRVFSRTLHDITASVPEIVEAARQLTAQALVLDGEALAFRPDGFPHPFQATMRRFGRKLEVPLLRETLPLTPLYFDCLHLEGEDMIDCVAVDRYAALQSALPPSLLAPRVIARDAVAAEAFLQEALSRGHEGIMAKALGARYEAGRRGQAWLKIKRAHTLDLVVLAAEWGHGRRRGWLSNLHVGARDPVGGSFVMLGKTFKGLTDEMLTWQTQRLQELSIAHDASTVYVRPELVVELTFNSIQSSPHYPAGLALRFARLKRYRPDKPATLADTIEAVRALYARQEHASEYPHG